MKNKNNQFASVYSSFLFRLAIHPLSYAVYCLVAVFASLQFFLGQQFFTETGSTDLHHFFTAFPYIGIIAVPAVCAILPSRQEERIYPQPQPVILFAKLCALMTLIAGSVASTVVVPIAVSFFGTVDVAQCICGYFGIILYFFTAVSFTLFVGTAVSSTAGAALLSSLLLAVVNSAHLLPLYVRLPSFLSSFLHDISFAWHFDSAGKGIIDTRDSFFYLTTTVAFIMLGSASLSFKKGESFSLHTSRSASFKKIFLLMSLIVVLLYADSSRIFKRFDVTANKKFTVSEYSRTLLSEVDEPLQITYYRSTALQQLYPQVRDVNDFLDEYASQNSLITKTLINPSSDKKYESTLSRYGISPQQLQTANNESTSYSSVYSAIIVEYLDRTETIPFVLNTTTLEYDLSSRIASLVRGTKRSVQILVGNGQSLQNEYSYVTPWLESQGFTVTQTQLPDDDSKELIFENDIPLLVIGTSQFNASSAESLEQFILRGGTTFIATTPYTVDTAGTWDVTEKNDKVCRMLSSFGITFKDTITADISNFRLTMYSDTNSDGTIAADTKTEQVNYSLWPVLRPQTNALTGMTLFWPCAIDYAPSSTDNVGKQLYTPLLVTSKASWQYQKQSDKFVTNPFTIQNAKPVSAAAGPFTVAAKYEGELNGYYTTDKGVTRGIILFGDQYAFSTMMLNYTAGNTGDFRSLDFLTDSLISLQGQQAILSLKNRNYTDTSLYKVSLGQLLSLRVLILFITCFIPCILSLVCAFAVYIARKKYNAPAPENKRVES